MISPNIFLLIILNHFGEIRLMAFASAPHAGVDKKRREKKRMQIRVGEGGCARLRFAPKSPLRRVHGAEISEPVKLTLRRFFPWLHLCRFLAAETRPEPTATARRAYWPR